MDQTKVHIHEWTAVWTIILGLITLTIITIINSEKPSQDLSTGLSHFVAPQEIEVTIEGMVEFPGTYTIRKGSRIENILALAKPLPEANLDKLNRQARLHDGKRIRVPATPMITITITGAVENPGTLRVKKGTTLQDLQKNIGLKPTADTTSLQKKRRLKDGETINIPIK